MSLLPLIVTSLLATSLWQQPQPAAPGQLRWIRGAVTDVSDSSVTLKLRDSSLTLARQPGATNEHTLAIGSTVDAHYTDRKGERRLVLVIAGPGVAGQLSKRPGHSYRGIVERTKWGTLSIRVEGRKRSVSLEKKTKLLAGDGTSLASGSKEISARLKAGDEVLVTYDEVSSDIPAGDIVIPSSSLRALEIRMLPANAS